MEKNFENHDDSKCVQLIASVLFLYTTLGFVFNELVSF